MRLFSKSNLATIAVIGGIVLVSGTGGAVAGAVITGAQIKDGTVTGKDIRDASIGRPDLTPAARGVSGAKVVNATTEILSGNWEKASATCPAGTKVVSAEGWLHSSRGAVQVEVAGTTGIAWSPIVESDDTVQVRVLCGRY